MGDFPGKWRSLALGFGAKSSAGLHDIQAPEVGLWALAQDVVATPGGAAALLLAAVQAQVARGEDLTAAFLSAHGRAQRELNTPGARIVALRRHGNSFELAWVGAMRAFLVRQRRVLTLTRDIDGGGGGYLVTTERMSQLGAPGRTRPKIDRNLVNAQKGDYLVLCGDQVDEPVLHDTLPACLHGLWSFDYKARRVQDVLNKHSTAPGRVVICQAFK